MKNLIIGSVSCDAGKTSVIVGLAKALNNKFGYLKPFGDRLVYRKKRLWDYDSALITNIFGLEQSSEDMTIGFEHAKLRYMYDEAGTKAKLMEMAKYQENGYPTLFVEGGKDLSYGAAIKLDTLSITKYLNGKLILVVSGDDGTIADSIVFLRKYILNTGIDYGVIINKVNNLEDYKQHHLPDITRAGVNVLGVIPYDPALNQVSMSYIADRLQARVIAGENGLNQRVKHVFVGAMSGDSAAQSQLFKKSNKIVITGGDRSDMIVAALDKTTSGIILTNNIVPPQNLVSKATCMNIPMLLVPFDTFQTAKQVDDMIPLLTRDDTERINIMANLVKQHVDLKSIL